MKKKEVSQTKLNFWTIWTVLKLQVLVKSILCKSVLCLMPKKKKIIIIIQNVPNSQFLVGFNFILSLQK